MPFYGLKGVHLIITMVIEKIKVGTIKPTLFLLLIWTIIV